MEKISIVIPVYNAELTLEGCLESVKNQSYKNLEILIINDGSVDRTLEICEMYAAKDSRIKIFTQRNKGVSSARNLGIENASGEYLAFVDADDYIEKNMFKCLHQMYQDGPEVDLVICNCDIEMKEGYRAPKMQCPKKMSQIQAICSMFGPKSVRGYLCNKLFRTDIIKKNKILLDDTIHMSEDLLFCCQYDLYIREARYTDQRLYHYIMNFQGATWGEYSPKRFTEFYAFEKIRKIVRKLDNKDINNVLDAEYIVVCIRLIKKELKKNRSLHTEEIVKLMKGVQSTGWRFLCSDWGWKYKMFYMPLKIISQFYKGNS